MNCHIKDFSTDLIIVGAGSAGLMAAVTAGEADIRVLALERKSKPGRKLLMCGNSRCNLTTNISHDRMLNLFGEPITEFLKDALTNFPPSALQRWFSSNGLKTTVKTGNKVYPHTERATDVLNLFTEKLRSYNVPLCLSAPVSKIEKLNNGFLVHTQNFKISSRFVLIATGGISYPATGSVGDGQLFAKELGHTIQPYAPGLVGYDVDEKVLANRIGKEFDNVRCKLLVGGKEVTETRGVYKIEKWGIGGTAITNTSRYVSRKKLKNYTLIVTFENGREEKIKPLKLRPIKEAQVTVGGVDLKEIDSKTMESNKCQGLYFAGEVMDVDGPTGGYNLHASFATARLAIASIASKLGREIKPIAEPSKNKHRNNCKPTNKKRQNKNKRYHKKY